MLTSDIVLDKWQEDILKEDGNILFAKGRRIGATYIFARKAVKYMMEHENNHPSSQLVCVSLTEDQAELIIAFATLYAQKKCKKYLGTGKDKPTLRRLILKVNGNRRILLARPVGNTGDAARGFEGQILMVDEAPRMPPSFWTAAKPILATTGGKIWMWGTFFGKGGYFWDRFDEVWNEKLPNARFKVFHKDTEEVAFNRPISASWTEEQRREMIKFLDDEKHDMSELEYGQEYLGIASADLKQYFSEKWIDKVCHVKIDDIIPKEGFNSLGVDIARMGGDYIAFEALRKLDNKHLWQYYHETKKEKLTTWTEDRIVELTSILNLNKIYLDAGAGSLGVGVLDHLMRISATKRKVEAVNNRKIVIDREGKTQRLLKEDLYDNLKALGDRGELHLYDLPAIRLSLSSVQYEYIRKPNQKSSINIFSNPHYLSDVVEALIRAAVSSKEKFNKLWISYM